MAQAVHLLSGDEFLVIEKSKAIIATLIPDIRDPLSLEIIDGQADATDAALAAIGRCREALNTLGFMGGRKVIWFRGVSFLADSQTGKVEAVKAAVSGLAELIKRGLPVGVSLVISTPKVDKRFALFKAVQGLGEVHDFTTPDKPEQAVQQTAPRVRALLAERGLTMSDAVRDLFLNKVGTDMRTISQEVDKLACYLGGKRAAVSRDDLEAITSTARDALSWDIQDAFGRREVGRALAVLRQLLFQRESPMALVALLEGRIRDLLVYREALDRGWLHLPEYGRSALGDQVPAEAMQLLTQAMGRDVGAVHPYRLQLLLKQAQCFTVRELRRGLAAATKAHRQLVTTGLPPAMVLELLLLKLLPQRTAR